MIEGTRSQAVTAPFAAPTTRPMASVAAITTIGEVQPAGASQAISTALTTPAAGPIERSTPPEMMTGAAAMETRMKGIATVRIEGQLDESRKLLSIATFMASSTSAKAIAGQA